MDKAESKLQDGSTPRGFLETESAGEFVVNHYLTSVQKRIMDVVFSICGLVLIALFFPFVAIVTILTSGLPIFYRRDRLGLYGQQFSMVKFRTMTNGTRGHGQSLRTEQNDPRISKFGRFLRKAYIDELPQFWNVLKGEMSVVGPRPEFPELAAELSQIRKKFPRRLAAKPGVTGLAQVRYSYSYDNAHAAGRLPYDLVYIKKASLRVDLWIILQTVARSVKFGGT